MMLQNCDSYINIPSSQTCRWRQECFSRRWIAAQQAVCGSVRYGDAETIAPPNYIAQPLQYLHVEMTSNALSRRYELMVSDFLTAILYC
jgi:hypothetical protein